MPSLKDLRNRIASVKATQKITKAMQMVAAAKLRRAQQAAEAARPYAERMGIVLANLANSVTSETDMPLLLRGTGKDRVHLLLVCTSERGLCGAFNASIVRLVREHVTSLLSQDKEVKILCIGKKGYDQLKRHFASHILDVIELRGLRTIGFDVAEDVSKRIFSLFEQEAFDVCTLFYARFQSVISQIPTAQQIIPAHFEPLDPSGPTPLSPVYEYEPGQEEILRILLPRHISVQIFRALLENAASEQGARTSAMDSATRNAGEMIKKQTLTYNRSRQAMITKELIEIISGAEAL